MWAFHKQYFTSNYMKPKMVKMAIDEISDKLQKIILTPS
jgi:hypothetical protein